MIQKVHNGIEQPTVPSFTVLRGRISTVLHKIVMLEQRRQQVIRSSERGCTRCGFAVGDGRVLVGTLLYINYFLHALTAAAVE